MKFTHDGTVTSMQTALDDANGMIAKMLAERETTRFSASAQIVSSAKKRVEFAVKGLTEAFNTILDDASALDLEFRKLQDFCNEMKAHNAVLATELMASDDTKAALLAAQNELVDLKAFLVTFRKLAG